MKKIRLMQHIYAVVVGILLLVLALFIELFSVGGFRFVEKGSGWKIGTEFGSSQGQNTMEAGKQIHRVADGDRVGCLNLWSASGSASATPMIVYYDAQDAGIQAPQIIYIKDEQATSVFCTQYGAALSTGNVIELCSEEAYNGLNIAQKAAISQVLGSAYMASAPRDEAHGYLRLNTGECTFENFQLYVSAQLMIWYYIDAYSDAPGSGTTGGITWEGLERTCAAGWGSSAECWRIWESVSKNYIRPDFAEESGELAEPIELAYHTDTDCYEALVTDTQNILSKFQIMDVGDLQCIRCNADGSENAEGNSLLIRSENPILPEEARLVSLQRRVAGSTIYYIENLSEPQDMVLYGGGLDLLVDAYMRVYTQKIPTVLFEKRDEDSKELLSGVHLQVLEGDSLVADWVTDGAPYTMKHLQAGHTYRLHEVQAADGYLPGQDMIFTVEDSINPQTITMYNRKTSLEVSKLDAATGAELPGAKLELFQGNELLESWISKETPHVIRGLRTGIVYRLRESLAPLGYRRFQDMNFTLTGEDIQKLVVENQLIRGNLLVKKTDSETGKGLQGAVIELYRKNGSKKEQLGAYESDTDGEIRIDNLEYGEYYIIEVQAPDGYICSNSAVPFTIDGSREEIELEIKNTKEEETTEPTTSETTTTEEVTTEAGTTQQPTTEIVTTEVPVTEGASTEPSTLVLGASIEKETPKTNDTSIPILVFGLLVLSGVALAAVRGKK